MFCFILFYFILLIWTPKMIFDKTENMPTFEITSSVFWRNPFSHMQFVSMWTAAIKTFGNYRWLILRITMFISRNWSWLLDIRMLVHNHNWIKWHRDLLSLLQLKWVELLSKIWNSGPKNQTFVSNKIKSKCENVMIKISLDKKKPRGDKKGR